MSMSQNTNNTNFTFTLPLPMRCSERSVIGSHHWRWISSRCEHLASNAANPASVTEQSERVTERNVSLQPLGHECAQKRSTTSSVTSQPLKVGRLNVKSWVPSLTQSPKCLWGSYFCDFFNCARMCSTNSEGIWGDFVHGGDALRAVAVLRATMLSQTACTARIVKERTRGSSRTSKAPATSSMSMAIVSHSTPICPIFDFYCEVLTPRKFRMFRCFRHSVFALVHLASICHFVCKPNCSWWWG